MLSSAFILSTGARADGLSNLRTILSVGPGAKISCRGRQVGAAGNSRASLTLFGGLAQDNKQDNKGHYLLLPMKQQDTHQQT